MLRLSFSTGALYHWPLRNTFAIACEAGFDGVELVVGPEVVARGASYVRFLSQEHDLPVLSVHPPILPYPGMNHPTHVVPRLISLAEQVGSPLLVLHTPKVTSTEHPQWKDFVAALTSQGTNPYVRISPENAGLFRPSEAEYVLHDLQRLGTFAEQHGLPVTFDTAHAGTMPTPLLDAFRSLNGRVANIHFSDLRSGRLVPDWKPLYTFFRHHQMPGAGFLPLTEFVSLLLQTGYSGIVTLEVSPTALQAWSFTHVRVGLTRAIDFVRRAEGAAGRAN